MNTNSLPPEKNFVKGETNLSHLTWRLLYQLSYLFTYFKSKGKLNADGSYSQSNKQLYTFLKCEEKSLIRVRKILVATSKIKFRPGGTNHKRSCYWILATPMGKEKAGIKLPKNLPGISSSVLVVELGLGGKESVKKTYLQMGYSEAEFEAAFERVKR